ncbi:MAG: sigma-70 family RNA polymerase sigma factor [Sedimentisphaerales bacterium]
MDPDKRRFNAATAAKVFLDHKDFIRKVIFFHIHDEDQADDLFQDFFLSFVSRPLPGDIQNIESYLYKAITSDIIDAIRRKENYRNSIYEYGERSNHSCCQKTPEETVLKMEETSRILDIIEKRLPRTEAQAVYLQYRDSHNAKEIAEKMGVGAATVRGYVSEGLSRIRRLLTIKAE